ncbi:MAG: FAD-dependent oxidoreductase [Pseudomonadota bacterium]
MERIGVYICECGPNIKDAIDLDTVMAFARGLEDVFLVKRHGVLCSHECKTIIANDIQGQGLNRVVIAACSPKEHENTFKAVLQQAGLNPYLMQMANIREQCAWVVRDKKVATQKAKEIIRAAVDRVKYHESLTVKEVECQPHVLVVGAGIAGIAAALTLARKDRRVYLIEKSPCIGGKVTRYEDLFPTMECAPCLVDPRLDEVLHNPNIDVLTLSEVREVLGFYGNFVVKVNGRARFVDVESCVGCGACVEVCPVTVKNEFNEGLDERKAIYIPYAGALPNVAAIDGDHCLRWQGRGCTACQEACPFGSIHYDDRDQVQELKAGAIVLSTGFDLFDPKRPRNTGTGK